MKKLLLIITAVSLLFISCATVDKDFKEKDIFTQDNEAFLKPLPDEGDKIFKEIPNIKEAFRVLLTSDEYRVVQMNYSKTIERNPDPGGDKFISSEMGRYDMLDEARIGIVSVWLYPDSGRIMRIRSQRPTYFKEIDSLINEDIMRWSFNFPKKVIEPVKFDIVYRVVLRKKKSDEEIIQEVQKKIREEQ